MKKLIVVLMMLTIFGSVFAERKALVIANTSYGAVTVGSAKADADSMEAALNKLEFSVERFNNLRLSSLMAAIDSFAGKLTPTDEVVFYYSGHGTNAGGINYLVPSGVNLGLAQVFSKTAYSVSTLAQNLKPAACSIIILEASRSWGVAGSKAIAKPFVAMPSANRQQVIISSAQPSKGVQFSLGSQSTFTQALIERISTSEEGCNTVFPLVAGDVQARTSNLQKPWISGTLAVDFYFITHEMKVRWNRYYYKEEIDDGGGSLSW